VKILDWINKIFKRDIREQLEEAKRVKAADGFKERMHFPVDDKIVKENISRKQLRDEQIKAVDSIVLLKEGKISKEDIENIINKTHEQIILNEADIQTLISIHDVVEYEDMHAENNIREFIEESEENIIKLVDKLEEFATEEAKKQGTQDISPFIPTDVEIVDKLKRELVENEVNNDEKGK